MNRQQRRQIAKAKGQKSFAEAVGARKMIEQAVRESAKESRRQIDVVSQRCIWAAAVALNRAFGFGPDRVKRFLEAMNEVADEIEKDTEAVDGEYATDKLRQAAEQVSGIHIEYIHEKENREAREVNRAAGIIFD